MPTNEVTSIPPAVLQQAVQAGAAATASDTARALARDCKPQLEQLGGFFFRAGPSLDISKELAAQGLSRKMVDVFAKDPVFLGFAARLHSHEKLRKEIDTSSPEGEKQADAKRAREIHLQNEFAERIIPVFKEAIKLANIDETKLNQAGYKVDAMMVMELLTQGIKEGIYTPPAKTIQKPAVQQKISGRE